VGLGFTPLSNGNYVIGSPYWNHERGAVTWGNGSTGISDIIYDGNSLVGSNPGDQVGRDFGCDYGCRQVGGVTALSNGNYVVDSLNWNGRRGAVTWGSGSTGVSGPVSDANSLVGSNPYDQVGINGVTPLSNGNYVVSSSDWNGSRGGLVGAVTWANGSTGVTGTVSDANSLVGNNAGDSVGIVVTPLSNGNYVVSSGIGTTWVNGTTAVTGIVSEANTLIGGGYATPLSNGNYVVRSPYWNDNRGAVTWANGNTEVSGTVSGANSLVGSNTQDFVGAVDESGRSGLIPLSNGNYVVESGFWNGIRGAATWGNGNTGVSGTVSEANSLVGSSPGDLVSFNDVRVIPLSNGNYVVRSPYWNDQRGAVTWANGSTGISGIVSETNSLVGSNPGDLVGILERYGATGVTPLSNGNYVVQSPNWNGTRGAVSWVSGTTGQTLDGRGVITTQNSLVGRAANSGIQLLIEDLAHQSFLAFSLSEVGEDRITVGLPDPNQFSYARGQAQTVTLTPDFLTRTLNTGTAVVLQASNDITVEDPIVVSAGGHGGALTLQAGRSIVVNASITTDNGALNLIANDQLANGVVDSQRDPGQAVITMAAGTSLDTGAGTLTVELRDGVGLTNRDSGAITLQTATAGSVSVVNNGPSPGSNVSLGQVTTSGLQSYANPNGTTLVTGNLTATDNPITFSHSVVLNAGLILSAGSSTVTFAAGTVSPSPGVVTVAGGVVLTGSTTFSATLNGTDPGNYSQLAADGPINLGGGTLSLVFGFEPPVGSTFEILTNTGPGPINGTFNGLDEGTVLTQGGYQFQITYHGGTGGCNVVLIRLA
jgi:hypothetical protein